MRFDGGETWDEKRVRLEKPHRRFAWRPVCVGPHDYRFLEFVTRQGCLWYGEYWEWDYWV